MERRFCTHCGEPLEDGAHFCAHCGAEVGQTRIDPIPDKMDMPPDLNPEIKSEETKEPQTQPGNRIQYRTPRIDNDPPNNPAGVTSDYPPALATNQPEASRGSDMIKYNSRGSPVIEFRRLHPNSVWLKVMDYVKQTYILVPVFFGVLFVQPLVSIILFSSYFIIIYLIAKLYHKNFIYQITEKAFSKEFGILNKQIVNVPFDQIQNVNIRRPTVHQMLNLCHIDIETAGQSGVQAEKEAALKDSFAEAFLPGVSTNEAREIRDLLLARVHETD